MHFKTFLKAGPDKIYFDNKDNQDLQKSTMLALICTLNPLIKPRERLIK